MPDPATIIATYARIEAECDANNETPPDGAIAETVAGVLRIPVDDVKAAVVADITKQGAG
jgi:hypothetical protein